jgi:hypothetical protein
MNKDFQRLNMIVNNFMDNQPVLLKISTIKYDYHNVNYVIILNMIVSIIPVKIIPNST